MKKRHKDKSEETVDAIMILIKSTCNTSCVDEAIEAMKVIDKYREKLFKLKKELKEHLSDVIKIDENYKKVDLDYEVFEKQLNSETLNRSAAIKFVIVCLRVYYNKRIEFYRNKLLEYGEKDCEYELLD